MQGELGAGSIGKGRIIPCFLGAWRSQVKCRLWGGEGGQHGREMELER